MLCELRVENLLLIERAELELCEGLNVLTGETGAGKTMLAQALDLLIGSPSRPGASRGGSPRAGIVRPGADAAYVEGVFAVPEAAWAEVESLLPETVRGLAEPGELVLARRVGADGRTRAYAAGRSLGLAELRELGARLVSFYGQHEHRKLVLAASQLQLLDSVCGAEHAERLRACAASHREARRLAAELDRLDELALARERELGLLEHELAEIDAAEPDADEYQELLQRRERLRSVEALREACAAAVEALAPETSEGVGAAHLLATAVRELNGPAGVDAQLDELARRAEALNIEADDLVGSLRVYHEGIEGEQGSLQALEERLATLERLMRKHGGSIAAVLDYAGHARERAEELSGAEQAQGETRERLRLERAALAGHAARLHETRARAAHELAQAVRAQLAALAMPDASFEIELIEGEPRADGADAVEFTIAPNPGVAAAPLRQIASGGELSRVMLALASACEQAGASAGHGSTLVFDEVDAGIGGHTARAVGERLRMLGGGQQVICITHLPQIASLAQRHFTVRKDTVEGTTLATVARLSEHEVEGELMRMLGAEQGDGGARRHARQLRRAA